jgi:hypothetical protein
MNTIFSKLVECLKSDVQGSLEKKLLVVEQERSRLLQENCNELQKKYNLIASLVIEHPENVTESKGSFY